MSYLLCMLNNNVYLCNLKKPKDEHEFSGVSRFESINK